MQPSNPGTLAVKVTSYVPGSAYMSPVTTGPSVVLNDVAPPKSHS